MGETRRDRNRERDRGSEREAGTESMTRFMSLERSMNGSDVLCTHVPHSADVTPDCEHKPSLT